MRLREDPDTVTALNPQLIGLVQYGVLLPDFLVFNVGSQPFGEVPVLRKAGEVEPSAHASHSPEQVRVAHRQEQGPMASHAVPGNGSAVSFSYGTVFPVYFGKKLFCYIGLVLHGRIDGAVEIPAGDPSVRAYDDKLVPVGQLPDTWNGPDPFVEIVSGAVEQVNHRKSFFLVLVTIRNDDHIFKDLVHRQAANRNSVYTSSQQGQRPAD